MLFDYFRYNSGSFRTSVTQSLENYGNFRLKSYGRELCAPTYQSIIARLDDINPQWTRFISMHRASTLQMSGHGIR